MIFDISKPDHEVALRWACETKAAVDAGEVVSIVASSQAGKLKLEALTALSSHAASADLFRQLVERAGVPVLSFAANAEASPVPFVSMRDDAVGVYVEVFHHPHRGSEKHFTVAGVALAAAVARLFSIAPKAGLESTLMAMKGPA